LQPDEIDVLPEHIHNNFCRNPDESERPWCYFDGGELGDREFCEIQPCEEMEKLGFTFESAVTMHLEGTALGPTHAVDAIESSTTTTQMRACCPNIIVCGQTGDHVSVTGHYHFNARGRYYKHNDEEIYYYYDRRFKKWLISESMYNHQTYGYLNSSAECPSQARESPLMAYSTRFSSGFEESQILTGCARGGAKNQVYQCSVPSVLPEIATAEGPVGLNGNSRTIISASEYFGKFSRIQGGVHVEEAIPGSWPHQVSLQGPAGHFCGGALINPDFVLTSGRCADLIGKFGYSAVLGVHDITGAASQRICIKSTIKHPDYDRESGSNDLAIIRLAWSAAMDAWTNPTCIMHDEIPPEMVCVATGWGSARNDPLYYPTKLQQYPIPFKRPCHTEQKLCASTGGIGACTADVGSPLACYSKGKWLLAGIASAEGPCDDSETTRNYFMRASLYQDWIDEVMLAESYVASWSEWSKWTDCSRECGVGIRTRERQCSGAGSCEGTNNEKEACMSGKECSKLSHPMCRGLNGLGRKQIGRIVGGHEAEQSDWPFIVMIAERARGKTGQFCGGTIISERWVISAGHCFQGWGAIDPHKYILWAGAETRYKTDDMEQQFFVTEIICHEEFLMSSNTIVNDICLMKTDRALKFNERVSPICMPEEIGGPEIGQMCKVGGWGDTMGTGNQFVLNEVSVPIITYDQCQNWYDDEFIRIFEEEHLCAGYEQGQLDACQGDSGGPFVCHHDVDGEEVAVLQGVVSFGVGCAEARNPGVYTRLTNYLDFVSSIVVDACASEPCKNGGICTLSGKQDYVCDCRTGFSGTHCEIDEIALQIGCDDDPCMNDAVCKPAHNTYRCECNLGWAGRICDREVPQCKIPYSSGGGRIIGLGMLGITTGMSASGGGGGFRGRRDTNGTDLARSGMNIGGGIDRDIYDNRIVGGEVSVAGAWPWIVQISDKYGQYCSGVIVGKHFVLTAQPCVHNTEPEEIYIVAGAFQINTPEDSRAVYTVSSIHCNKDTMYKEDSICVIHISEAMIFGNYVQPMCMPDSEMIFSEGSRCFLAGWGETFNAEQDGSKLHELEMPLFTDEHCKNYYQQKNIRSYSNEDHVCAGYFDQRGACTGDAGGPLMCLHGGNPTVAGILSWSEGCRLDSVPAVFSDLTAQLKFVTEIMDDPCLDNPCENGGSCEVQESGGYVCACPSEFGGTNCENDLTNIDDCADEPCKNGGSCTDQLGGFNCECTDAFYGDTCEEEIPTCRSADALADALNELEGPRAKYPWAAFLRLSAGRSTLGSPFCAATIVGPHTLLTTASCVYNIDKTLIGVEYGFEDPAGSTVKQMVSAVHIHPMYSFYEHGSNSFDIAVVQMEDSFVYGNYVRAACVSKKEELPMGAQCKLSGIGNDGVIREAKLTKVVMGYCRMWNPTEGKYILASM